MGTTGSNFSQCFRHLRRKGKALRARKPLSAKGLKRPGRLAAGKAEDHWLSRQGPAGPLADLAFPSVRTQLGLWDFTSHRRHFFSLGAQKGRKELKFHQAADKELPLKKVIWFRFAPNAKKLCRLPPLLECCSPTTGRQAIDSWGPKCGCCPGSPQAALL